MNETLQGYELKVSALAAALKCAAVKDVRWYLNSVYLDFPRGCIVATDGHRLFCGQIPAADCVPVIVPRELVERAIKVNRTLGKKFRETCALVVNIKRVTDAEGVRRVVEFNHALAGACFEAPALDATFVDYERIINLAPDGKPSAYNPQYLADASDALNLYAEAYRGQPLMRWRMGGEGPGLFTWGDAPALCVIMPIRQIDKSTDFTWFTKAPESLAPAADPLA
jgi:hypothetical protein